LKIALSNAAAGVLAFKKEMGFGKKVVKLKYGTREDFKKYFYNWEYFYICFFLSAIIFFPLKYSDHSQRYIFKLIR
jgi:hypothetical protein